MDVHTDKGQVPVKHCFDTTAEYVEHLMVPVKRTLSVLVQHPVVKLLLAGAMGVAHAFVSDHLGGVMVLLALVLVDQITGVLSALKSHTFCSSKFRHGIVKLMMYLLLILTFHLVGSIIEFDTAKSLDRFAILYLIATETLSIIENVQAVTGIRLPKWMGELLKSVGKRKG